jgi:hypothetical protein
MDVDSGDDKEGGVYMMQLVKTIQSIMLVPHVSPVPQVPRSRRSDTMVEVSGERAVTSGAADGPDDTCGGGGGRTEEAERHKARVWRVLRLGRNGQHKAGLNHTPSL